MDMSDGPLNQPVDNLGNSAAGITELRTEHNLPLATVSSAPDGGRSSASQLIAEKISPLNPVVVNNQPVINAGGDAQLEAAQPAAAQPQVPQPAAAANPGSLCLLFTIDSSCL